MISLSEHIRTQLFEMLSEAPDHVLLDAVQQTLRAEARVKFFGSSSVSEPVHVEAQRAMNANISASLEEIAPGAKPYTNTAPPGFACSRAGQETVSKILHICRAPVSLSVVNELLKRGPGKMEDTKSVLKLMWDRKQLTYSDGAYEAAP